MPLHDTADELCAVAKDLRLAADDIVLGAKATEANIKKLSAEGKPTSCTLDGRTGVLSVADGEVGLSPGAAADSDVIVAPIDLKMRSAIELRRASGNPIVLVDQLGRMAGLCGDDEIYRALLQQRRAAAG